MQRLRARYSKIERVVESLLQKHRIRSAPVPIWEIAKAEGAQIVIKEFNNEVSGLLVRTKTASIIAVEKRQPMARQRFTAAHELGHLLLHANREVRVDTQFRVYMRSLESSKAQDIEEIESNAFAASLLMPEPFIQSDICGLVLDIEDTKQVHALAERYEVSNHAITLRLVNLLSFGRI
jgi:Zn-dependent peptidase ImmA (M78 family)